jgi:type I restriction enzyme, S subunit
MPEFPRVPIRAVAKPTDHSEAVMPGKSYRQVGVRLWGLGAYERETLDGADTQYRTLSRMETGDIVVNKIWARNGSVAVIPPELAGCYGSGEFPAFAPDQTRLDPRWFHWITKTKWFWEQCDQKSQGTSGKNRIRPEQFLEICVPLPPLTAQRRIVARIEALARRVEEARGLRREAVEEALALIVAASANVSERLAQSNPDVPIGETFRYRNDLIRPTDGKSGSIRFIGLQHVESNTGKRIGEDNLQAEELTGRKFKFSPGEIVYGYLRPYLNKVWIADCDGVCSVDQYVIQPTSALVETMYLAHFMRSAAFLRRAIELTHNLLLPRLRTGLLESIPIPVPALAEQCRVANHLNKLQGKLDGLRQLQTWTQKEIDALMPSILARAFAGEL